jgi:hypothetical protein
MARVVELVVAIGWAAFWLYWLVAAFSRKRGRVPWSRELGIRAVIAVVVSGLGRLCTGEDSVGARCSSRSAAPWTPPRRPGRAPVAHPVEPGLLTWGYVLYEIRPRRSNMSAYPELHIVGWSAHRSA